MASRKFPSMAALRGFEACVRHLNFSQAALELHLTQSAISHQIRQLEALLGTELFDRSAAGMALTQAGHDLLPIVRDFLKDYSALATRFARDAQGPTTLELFVHDSFANTWLIPRLPGFYAAYPDIRIRLNTEDFTRFDNVSGQAAIRLAPRDTSWQGFHGQFILAERIFPVCSPALIDQIGAPATPADIFAYPVILRARSLANGTQISTPSWDYWLGEHGLTPDGLNCALTVPHSNMAVGAAIRGLGVAMARTSHISDELRNGALQKLFDDEMDSGTGYHFLCPPGKQNSHEIQAVLSWLKSECGGADTL